MQQPTGFPEGAWAPATPPDTQGRSSSSRDGLGADDERSLLAAVAPRRGHFRYESGHHGDLWLDLDMLLVEPQRTASWAAALARKAAPGAPEVVCGPLTGGAFLAQLVAAASGARFAFAEREATVQGAARYRIPETFHPLLEGRRVFLVDDAVNAGSALLATLAALRVCGAVIVGCACLVAQGDVAAAIAREHEMPLTSLLNLERRLWTPEACPLCRAGAPLTNPLVERG
jgi:orotate phosphoribosyltransferase